MKVVLLWLTNVVFLLTTVLLTLLLMNLFDVVVVAFLVRNFAPAPLTERLRVVVVVVLRTTFFGSACAVVVSDGRETSNASRPTATAVPAIKDLVRIVTPPMTTRRSNRHQGLSRSHYINTGDVSRCLRSCMGGIVLPA